MTYRVNKGKPTKLQKLHWWLLHHGRRRLVTIESLNGLVTFDSKDKAVGKHIFFRREYDVEEVKRTVQLLEDHGYIDPHNPGMALNVGANIGLITLALRRHSLFEHVMAFEPVPSNFEILKKNIAQNGYSNEIECLAMALSNKDGEITMELSGENFGDHRIRSSADKGHFHEEQRETISVTVGKLDSLIDQGKFENERPGLVWMDIQGHDGDFYSGAKEVISRYHVPVVGEFWPYGIKRAGFSSTQYCEIISSLFSHYYDPKGEREFCSVDSFASMFEKYTGPEDGSDIILVNESWKH
jgi:FkbM family methyltransferase